ERAEIGECRPRTKSAQSPADAENCCADNELAINRGRCGRWQFEILILETAQEQHSEPIDADRTGHDKEQRRIPRAEDVEEADDAAGIGHARDREASSKERAGQENEKQSSRLHKTARLYIRTVTIATSST